MLEARIYISLLMLMGDNMRAAYQEGREAFLNGEPTTNNPYPIGNIIERYDWQDGWWDTQDDYEELLGELDEKK